MKTIPLTKGKAALVDDTDFQWLSQWKWRATQNNSSGIWYAVRGNSKTTFYMHRVIMQPPARMVVDHRDGDGLNNQRLNLRNCTHLNNLRNCKLSKRNSSGYQGVSWHKARRKWRAVIRANNRQVEIGFFNDKIEAARAWDKKASELFGDFVRLNFPETGKITPHPRGVVGPVQRVKVS